ncbi:MAG TPA: SH3 domain-containing protein, partial [Longimicrobium sp.]
MSTALPAAALTDEPLARVLAFSRRFGRETTALAMHAALPLGLSPELVHLLRVNFVPRAPWIAEADLLLSPLCMEAGGGMYEMDPDVRGLLLAEMARTPGLGPARQRQVAQFLRLWAARALNDAADPDQQEHLRVQQWVALAYAEPARAAEELAGALRAGVERGSRPEVARVARLTAILSAPLAAEVELRRYAGAVQRVAAGAAAPVASGSGAVTVGGEALPALDDVVRLWRPVSPASGGATASGAMNEPVQQQANVADEPVPQQANVADEGTSVGPGYRVARVVVLGNRGAGKSTLIIRLAQGVFDADRAAAGTARSTSWVVSGPTRRGGQEVVFFEPEVAAGPLAMNLAGAAAVLVVSSAREPAESADRWITAVRVAGAACPVLLAAAWGDIRRDDRSLEAIAFRQGIPAPVAVSAATGQGVAELGARLRDAIRWDQVPTAPSRADLDALQGRIQERLGSHPVAEFGEGTRRELGAALDAADPEGALARAMECLAARAFVRAVGEPPWAIVRSEDYDRCLGEVWRFVGEARHDVPGLPAASLHALQEHFATHGLSGYLDAEPTPGVLELVIEDLVRRRWAYEVDARRGQLVVIPSLLRRDGAQLPSTVGPVLLRARWDGRVDDGFVLLLVRLADQGQVELINGRCAFATMAEATVRLDASEADGMAQVTFSSEQAVRDPRPLRELIRREITGALRGIAPPRFAEPAPESPPRTDMQPPEGVDLARACVVVLPFGTKQVENRAIDFDAVWEHLFRPAIQDVRLADGEPLVPVRVELPGPGSPLPGWAKAARMALVDLTAADAARIRELGLVPGGQTPQVVLVGEEDTVQGADFEGQPVYEYLFGLPEVLAQQRGEVVALLARTVNMPQGDAGAGGEMLVVTADQLNVREGPGSDQPVLGRLPKGARVEVLKEEGEWVLVQAHDPEISGWISRKFTIPESPPASKGAEPAPRRVRVTADMLNVREGPSIDHPAVGQVAAGTVLDRMEDSADGGWFRVRWPDGVEGWVSSRFVEPADESAETDAEPIFVAVFAPETVRPGEKVSVGLVLSTERHRKEAEEFLRTRARWPGERWGTLHGPLERGTDHMLRYRLPWHREEISIASLSWNGEWGQAEFPGTVEPAATPGISPLSLEIVRRDGTILQTMELDVEILPSEGAEKASPGRTAFACYAAADREAVRSRVAALRSATGVDVLVGEESVQGGEEWEKRLDAEICSRDVFLLFWSTAAAGSRAVRRDWRRALDCYQTSGRPEIHVQLLEDAPADSLPSDLREFAATTTPVTPDVLISSATWDHPEYVQAVQQACSDTGMRSFRLDLGSPGYDMASTARDAVDRSDVYVGVFAHRYGVVPEGSDTSLAEMEYDRAVDR